MERFKKVLFVVDADKPCMSTLERAGAVRMRGAACCLYRDAVGEAIMRGTTVSTQEKYGASYVKQVKERGAANLEALSGEITEVAGPFTPGDPKLKTHLVRGSARREIPALAKQLDVDLVVMGTVGHTGIPGLLMGDTTETILRQVDCSVLAVKPPGFVTPVTLDA
jgi:nucleotide-binding universal stress UspA family protein